MKRALQEFTNNEMGDVKADYAHLNCKSTLKTSILCEKAPCLLLGVLTFYGSNFRIETRNLRFIYYLMTEHNRHRRSGWGAVISIAFAIIF